VIDKKEIITKSKKVFNILKMLKNWLLFCKKSCFFFVGRKSRKAEKGFEKGLRDLLNF
jgi:hypothetical protein